MRFELAETAVIASPDNLGPKADEAIDLAKRGEATVYFECEGTVVEVSRFDSRDHLTTRWHVEHDFFGLHRRKRRMLYRAYVEEEMSMEEAARKCGVPLKVASLYIVRKGWKRSPQFWSERSPIRGLENARRQEHEAKVRERG